MASKQELLREAEALSMGIAQPQTPTTCFKCIGTLARCLTQNAAGTKFLTLQCPSFFTSIMRFFSEDWTESRRATASASLRRAYAACRKCNPSGRAIDGRKAFSSTCTLLSMVIVAPLWHWTSKRWAGNPYVNGHGCWPTSPDELFPFGPTPAVTTLVTLVESGVKVELLLTCVLAVDRRLVFPVLSNSQNRLRFIAMAIARWRAAAAAIASDLAKLRPPVIPEVRDRIAGRHMKSVEDISRLLDYIFFHPGREEADGPSFVSGHEEELFWAIHSVMDHLQYIRPSTRLDVERNLWYSVLARRGGELGDLEVPWYIRKAEDDLQRALDDPYLALRSRIEQQTGRSSCHARHCAKRVHEKETSGAYACCAACRVAKYCSRECQRADWQHASHPHKAVCPMLRELFSFVDMKMNPEEFAARCRDRNFPLGHVDRLLEWAENRDGKELKVVSDFEHGNGLSEAAQESPFPSL